MKETTLENTIFELKVKLYRTGTIHLVITNKLTDVTKSMVIRKNKLVTKSLSYRV